MAEQPVRTEEREGRRVLRLSGRLDVSVAAALHASAREAAGLGGPLFVDASEVEFLGTAALQILAALHRRLTEKGEGLRWLGASAEARAFAALGGFDTGLLGGPEPEPVEDAP